MIANDPEIDRIVKRVLNKSERPTSHRNNRNQINQISDRNDRSYKNDKHGKKSSDISLKYLNQPNNKDPKLYNYQLQLASSELQQKYDKLQKILNHKKKNNDEGKRIKSDIETTKQKLKQILEINQTLQLSLSKIRVSRSKYQVDKSQSISTSQYCCSRTKMHNSLRICSIDDHSISRSKKTESPQNAQETLSLAINGSLNGKYQIPYSKQFSLLPIQEEPHGNLNEDKAIQCQLNYLEIQQARIHQKRQNIQRLKEIIVKQNTVLQKYSHLKNKQFQVGKIAKCKTLKKIGNIASLGNIAIINDKKKQKKNLLITSPSTGSIMKTKRNKI